MHNCPMCKDELVLANAGILSDIPYYYCRTCKVEVDFYKEESLVKGGRATTYLKPDGSIDTTFSPVEYFHTPNLADAFTAMDEYLEEAIKKGSPINYEIDEDDEDYYSPI